MAVDNYTTWLSSLSKVTDNLVRPLYWLTNIPAGIQDWGNTSTISRGVL
jgi:hypothetical protein